MFKKIFVFALIVFALFSNDSLAQTKKQESIETTPIQVVANVMVLDSDNKFVDGIKTEDLKIFEDGIEQKVVHFAKKENLLNVGLVIDNTGSMRMELERVLFVGRTLIENLRQQDEAFITRFVSSNKVTIEQDWTSNKTQLQIALENMYIEGGQSALIDGMYLATKKILEREKTNTSKRYALILISDGEDRNSYYKMSQLFDLYRDSDVQIFPFILFTDQNSKSKSIIKNFANKIAFETGGTVCFREKREGRDELVNALKSIITELRSQYVIGYTSTNQNRKTLSRNLTFKVADGEKGEKRQGTIREKFTIPEEQK